MNQSLRAAAPFFTDAVYQKHRLMAGTFAVLAVALITQSQFWGFIQDDAYITLRYSQNLADGL